jgi:thiol-disulfide isomerase/thioredoxin
MSLDRVANLATIAACVIVSVSVGQRWWRESQRPGYTSYAAGDTIKNTAALNLTSSRQTLLIGTASTCGFCTRSMPFFHELVQEVRGNGGQAVGFTFEDPEVNRRYLRNNGVEVEDVVSANANGLVLKSTPLLILVDGNGKVTGVWRGMQSADAQSKVLERIRKGGQS